MPPGPEIMDAAYTYMLKCADGSLYTGWTTDLPKRLAWHNAGKGSRYTRSRLPVELVWWELHDSRSAARRSEAKIKRLTRQEKLAILVTPDKAREKT